MGNAHNGMEILLKEAVPDLKIHSITRLGNGKAGELFLVNNEIVFKTPLASDTSDSSLALEYEALNALQGKIDIPIPQPLYFGTLSDGRTFLGESLVPGEQFTQDLYEEFTQPEKDAIFAQMGDIFYQLHNAPIPPIKNANVYDSAENLAYFHENYTDAVKNALTPAEQAQIQKIADDFVAAMETDIPSVLCHGDLHFWNLNYNPATKKLCGLLDFGLVCYNDPLNDMRYFWSDTVIKMLGAYPGNVGEHAAARHLFYCICNLIEEAHSELADSGESIFIDMIKGAMYQEPLFLN